jgi:hypothetical protein
LKSDLEESNRAKNQLERLTYQLTDDMRALKNKFENQSFDFSQVTQDLKSRSRKIEEDHRQTVSLDFCIICAEMLTTLQPP